MSEQERQNAMFVFMHIIEECKNEPEILFSAIMSCRKHIPPEKLKEYEVTELEPEDEYEVKLLNRRYASKLITHNS